MATMHRSCDINTVRKNYNGDIDTSVAMVMQFEFQTISLTIYGRYFHIVSEHLEM